MAEAIFLYVFKKVFSLSFEKKKKIFFTILDMPKKIHSIPIYINIHIIDNNNLFSMTQNDSVTITFGTPI